MCNRNLYLVFNCGVSIFLYCQRLTQVVCQNYQQDVKADMKMNHVLTQSLVHYMFNSVLTLYLVYEFGTVISITVVLIKEGINTGRAQNILETLFYEGGNNGSLA